MQLRRRPPSKATRVGGDFLFARLRRLGYIFNDVSLVRRPILCARAFARKHCEKINKPAQRKRGPKPSSVLNTHNAVVFVQHDTQHNQIRLNQIGFNKPAKVDCVLVFVPKTSDNGVSFAVKNGFNHGSQVLSCSIDYVPLEQLYYIMRGAICQGVVSGYNNIFSLRPDAKTWIFSQFRF